MSGPFFDPEVLKRCVMQPAEAAAFRAKAVKRYVVHVDADGAMLMEEADTDLMRARLIMEVALLRFSRWSMRLGENHKMPRVGEYPPAVQSVMDKMRDFLGTDKPASMDALIHELANAFLAWPLPASVRADAVCMEPNYPNRIGTHLLTYTEARQMFQDILLPKI